MKKGKQMNRRTFSQLLSTSIIGGIAAGEKIMAQTNTTPADKTALSKTSFHIGMVIFDQMTNLDFVGPADVFSRVPQIEIHVLAKSTEPVTTDSGVRVLADMTLSDAPALDMLFVPGGPGTTALMEDAEILKFLGQRAPSAKWITSVCTGALILGAAGLLRGYNAATHWAAMEILPLLGAKAVNERVVIDRNRITGGGVTAGIDFALTIIAKQFGDEQAQLAQLVTEYNPAPPFKAGSPESAPTAIITKARELTKNLTASRRAAAIRAAQKFV